MTTIAESTAFKYNVFISYSRKDIDFARKLEAALESYRPPRRLPVPQRHLNVFRDESDFTGSEYIASLDKNLRDSSKLLVICSPRSRASHYVAEEIERFAQYRGAENIISVLVAGLPNNEAKPEQEEEKAFPEALLKFLPTPLAAEYRGFNAQKDRLNTGAFVNAWYKTLADIYADYHIDRDQVAEIEVRRQSARRKAVAATVTSIFLALTAITSVALYQWKQANTQRDTAVQNKRLLNKALEEFIDGLPEELGKNSTNLKILERVYGKEYDILVRLQTGGLDLATVDPLAARTELRQGNAQMQMGDVEGARESYNKILDRHGNMTAPERSGEEWEDLVSQAYDGIGAVLLNQGDPSRALDAHKVAFAICERRARAEAEGSRWKESLASSHKLLGDVEMYRFELDAAHGHYATAMDLYESLAQNAKDNDALWHGLASSQLGTGDVAVEQGKLVEALKYYSATRELAERRGSDSDWRLELIISRERIGQVLVEMGDYPGGKKELEMARALAEQLKAERPDSSESRKNVAILMHDIGNVYKSWKRNTDALGRFDYACNEFNRLVDQYGNNQEYQRLLAECLGNVSEIRLDERKVMESLDDLQRTLAIRDSLAKSNPDNLVAKRELAASYQQMGDWLALKKDYEGALTEYRNSLGVRAELARKHANHAKLQEDLAAIHAKIGSVSAAKNDSKEGISSYRQALAIRQKLAQQDPVNTRWRRDLATTYEELGGLLRSIADSRSAADYLAEAQRLRVN